jgi:hypothetical protein
MVLLDYQKNFYSCRPANSSVSNRVYTLSISTNEREREREREQASFSSILHNKLIAQDTPSKEH